MIKPILFFLCLLAACMFTVCSGRPLQQQSRTQSSFLKARLAATGTLHAKGESPGSQRANPEFYTLVYWIPRKGGLLPTCMQLWPGVNSSAHIAFSYLDNYILETSLKYSGLKWSYWRSKVKLTKTFVAPLPPWLSACLLLSANFLVLVVTVYLFIIVHHL